MAYQPHPKQVEAHKAFLVEGYKRGVLFWGRQSGKTFWSSAQGWIAPLLEQGRYFIVFKTYKQAKEVVWRQFIDLIPKELIAKKNEVDLIITFHHMQGKVKLPGLGEMTLQHDENMPASTLQLLGSDQADSHRGFKAHGMIFDEYADQDPDNWESVYKHFFTTTDGWAAFVGTPKGFNHFYDLVNKARDEDRWYYNEATWRDSPFVKEEFIKEERAEAEKDGKLSQFLQEVELEFRSVQGAVYPDFKRDIHVVKPEEIPTEGTWYVAIDFGWHTTATLFVFIDYQQNWWIVDEFYGHQQTLEEIIPILRAKMAGRTITLMVGDSAASDHIATMQGKGFPIVAARKEGGGGVSSISLGINLITQKLRPKIQLSGNPKPNMYISQDCPKFIKELEGYRYPEEKKDRNPDEKPMKVNDHGPDALRYLALHFKHGLKDNRQRIPKKNEFNEFGLL